jgi:hypothetical protein
MYSIGDLVDKLIIENIKIFSIRDKLHEKGLSDKEVVELNEKRLYKPKYADFNAFIDKEFTFNHSQAWKFIKVAKRFPLESDNPLCGLGISKLYELTYIKNEDGGNVLLLL